MISTKNFAEFDKQLKNLFLEKVLQKLQKPKIRTETGGDTPREKGVPRVKTPKMQVRKITILQKSENLNFICMIQ